jgi:hypothetical protein
MGAREARVGKCVWRWLVLAGMLCGCPSKDEGTDGPPIDTDTGTAPTGETAEPPPGPDLVVLPEHSYAADVTWTVQSTDIRARYEDLLFKWSQLTTDAWGLPIDPVAIEAIVMLEVLFPADEVAEHLALDDFGSSLLSVWEYPAPGVVFVPAASFTSGGINFNPQAFLVEEPGKTWLLGAADRDGDRLDLRAVLGMTASEESGNTDAELTDDSSSATWSATPSDVHLLTASGWELYSIDWEGLTTDALGKEYDKELGDELFVARFDSGVDLSAQILTLSQDASAWWSMDVERETDARLDLARDAQGGVFPGFTSGATWIVGVRCSTCLSPFPLWVSTVDVVDP